MDRKTQINLWYLIAAIFAVIWLRELWVTSHSTIDLRDRGQADAAKCTTC